MWVLRQTTRVRNSRVNGKLPESLPNWHWGTRDVESHVSATRIVHIYYVKYFIPPESRRADPWTIFLRTYNTCIYHKSTVSELVPSIRKDDYIYIKFDTLQTVYVLRWKKRRHLLPAQSQFPNSSDPFRLRYLICI